MAQKKTQFDTDKLDKIVAEARRYREQREQGYRERALKLYPWICGRCGREFSRENLQELTVHHKDHDHDNNPTDGSNWELLCLYCHDNEHMKYSDRVRYGSGIAIDEQPRPKDEHQPFADLKSLLNNSQKS